ncbi:MAG: insulinase family protein [Planctomycetes bacterium]|nr:insulinase family protein [Planctomycetota bacterium]
MKISRLQIILFAVLSSPAALSAQETRPANSVTPWAHENSDLEVDSRVHYGSFENGMRFAWADLPKPEDRVYLRLHVDAGSFAETDSQAGMAHFLEHMAFNGSDNFEAGTLIEWFQDHGMSFGADTNAHTAFSETVYKLDLPNRDEKTLREGMLVMSDFARGMTIADEEVQAEKGVIDGEQRERDSAGYRVLVQMLERQYKGTLLATRLPIGTKPVRDEFSGESVRKFYTKWYRPENMTMVIVGDLDGYNPEQLIAEFFKGFEGPQTPVDNEPAIGQPVLDDLFFLVSDEEIPAVQMTVANLKPYIHNDDTVEQRSSDLALRVAHSMLAQRFSEAVKLPETKYLSAGVGSAGGLKVFEGGDLSLSCKPEDWQQALTQSYLALRVALNFGFQDVELNEVRANLMRSLNEAVAREATASSAGLREAILSEVEDEIVPTDAAYDLKLFTPVLESLTVEDCLKALRDNWRDGTISITASGNLELIDAKQQFLDVYLAAGKHEIERPADKDLKPFAYSSSPENAGEVVSQNKIEDLDLWVVELSNGVRLNIKKTDFKVNEIMITSRLGEGSLAVPEDKANVGGMASFAFSGGGLVEHSIDDMRRLFAGKQVGTSLSFGEDAFSLGGRTTGEDLLLQFELMVASIEHPGYRPDVLDMVIKQLPLMYQQLEHSPQGPMAFDFVPAVLEGYKKGSILGLDYMPPINDLMSVDMQQIKELMQPLLLDAPLEISVVGDVDVAQVIQYAAQTFGAMSPRRAVIDTTELAKGVFIKPGVIVERSIETADEKASLMMYFPTSDGFDDSRRRNIMFLGKVVDDRLRLEVRERLGAAYSPGAGGSASTVFEGLGGIVVQAAGNPEETQILVDACLGVAKDLAENGVTQDEVDRLSEPLLNQVRDAMRTNSFWLSNINDAQSNPEGLHSLRTIEEFYANISVKDLTALAAEYLQPEKASYLVVTPNS